MTAQAAGVFRRTEIERSDQRVAWERPDQAFFAFEGRQLERVAITVDLATFCQQHHHRMPHHYWRDPMQRARDYVPRHRPPWL